MARNGQAILLVSDLLVAELEGAPDPVVTLLRTLPANSVQRIETTHQAMDLMRKYIEAGVLGPAHENDALHVANATVAGADIIVSWNFKHIVHFTRIRGFNSVNLREGYGVLTIHNPREVI